MSSILIRLARSIVVAVGFAAFAIPAVAAPRLSTPSAEPNGHDDVIRVWGRYGAYGYGGGYGHGYGYRRYGYGHGGGYGHGYGYRRYGYGYGSGYGHGYRPYRSHGGYLLGQIIHSLHGGYGYH